MKISGNQRLKHILNGTGKILVIIMKKEEIYLFQGNRNPFIDDPSLADRIGC